MGICLGVFMNVLEFLNKLKISACVFGENQFTTEEERSSAFDESKHCLRSITNNEILIEIDLQVDNHENRLIAYKLQDENFRRLEEEGYEVYYFDHQGKSPYLRLYGFDNLNESNHKDFFENFVTAYCKELPIGFKYDSSFYGKFHWCPLEFAKHWKYGTIHNLKKFVNEGKKNIVKSEFLKNNRKNERTVEYGYSQLLLNPDASNSERASAVMQIFNSRKECCSAEDVFLYVNQYNNWTNYSPEETRKKVYELINKYGSQPNPLWTNTKIREKALLLLISRERNKATELLVDTLKDRNKFYTTRSDEKAEIWIYMSGIYVPEGRTYIREELRQILKEAFTEQIANQVTSKIEADSYVDAEHFFSNNSVNEIAVENGILNIETKQLSTFSPDKIFFQKIPVVFDLEMKCEKIDSFFRTVLPCEEDVQSMYELFGFCLKKEYFIEKSFMFLGDGRNGKSKCLELLKRFLGPKNVVNIPLQKFERDQYSEAELLNKLANLAGDLSDQTITYTGTFKSLTGRDIISASRKYKTMVHFTNFAKQIFATNKLPKTNDTTAAFWERWVFFTFPYTFKAQQELDVLEKELSPKEFSNYKLKNPRIIEDISLPEEMSGLLNVALFGLERLNKNKKFTTSKSAKEIKNLWIRKSDSFLAFCIEYLEESPEEIITSKLLRHNYQNYCRNTRSIPESNKRIKEVLSREFGAQDTRKYVDQEQIIVWEGIKFKDGQTYEDLFSNKRSIIS